MEAVKKVLLENISSLRNALNYDLALLSSKVSQAESAIKKLPEDKQELTKIQRKYNLGDNVYNNF